MSILGVNRKSDILSKAEQLKGKLPFPFETIAVAVNFSPRYRSVIKEAARIAYLYKSKLILIHIGTLETDQKKKISDCVLDCHINESNFKIIDQQGPIVSTILNVCKDNGKENPPFFCVSVPKRCFKRAVDRNKVKRRIKSALNNIKINLNGNYLITYNSLNIMSYHKIEKTLTEIFKVLK